MSAPRDRQRFGQFSGYVALVMLCFLAGAQQLSTGSVSKWVIGALLAIVLTTGGTRLDRAILRELGDRIARAAEDE